MYNVQTTQPQITNVMNQKNGRGRVASIRKHRSLDGSQFLNQFVHSNFPHSAGQSDRQIPYYTTKQIYNGQGTYFPSSAFEDFAYPIPNYEGFEYPNLPDEFTLVPSAEVAQSLNQLDNPPFLKREYLALNDKFNYLLNSIRTFWSPELRKERQIRRDESMRINAMQYKISQQASEIQMVRNQLDMREQEIAQLLSDTDLADLEMELRHLRQQLSEKSKDNSSPQDYQAAKSKLERIKIELAEKTRDIQTLKIRLSCCEEQKLEVDKRNEILSRTNSTNDGQIKMLHEDLDVLRKKVEFRNQALEEKDKQYKKLERDFEESKRIANELAQIKRESEQRVSQLSSRMGQLEAENNDKISQIEKLKQELRNDPAVRNQNELQQRLKHSLEEQQRLTELTRTIQRSADEEKQQQLKIFNEETFQMKSVIDSLQKELSDRHILITSQNEKISQMDENFHNVKVNPTSEIFGNETKNETDLREELEETRKEVDRLLKMNQNLEKEKAELNPLLDVSHGNVSTVISSARVGSNLTRECEMAKRISDLEVALSESVGITSEKEQLINDQKQSIQQMSDQITRLLRASDALATQRALKDGQKKLFEVQTILEEERARFRQQMMDLKKEFDIALINEKESLINLIEKPGESLRDKINLLIQQREQLKSSLFNQQNIDGLMYSAKPSDVPKTATKSVQHLSASDQFPNVHISGPAPISSTQHPLNVHTVQRQGFFGPESISYYAQNGSGEDGVWA